MYNFGPAAQGETVVFGAERPGYDSRRVDFALIKEWIKFMKGQGIRRVCCLLPEAQLAYYPTGLIRAYFDAFGEDNVLHAPVEDFHLVPLSLLAKVILPFLAESERDQQKVVMHCSGGSGRTGHVLAAWLVHARSLPPEDALLVVESTSGVHRNPREALGRNATETELIALLEACRA